MKYLVRKEILEAHQDRPQLFVLDTHTFNLKGVRKVSLTDIREYAQRFTLSEGLDFVKKYKGFTLIEDLEEDNYDYIQELDKEEYEDE